MERPTSLILATNHRLNAVPYIFLFLKRLIITTQRVRFMSSGFWFTLSKTVRVLTHYRTLTSNCLPVCSLSKSHPNKTKLYPLVLSIFYIQNFKKNAKQGYAKRSLSKLFFFKTMIMSQMKTTCHTQG